MEKKKAQETGIQAHWIKVGNKGRWETNGG